MAKTRRRKQNKSPKNPFGNSRARVVTDGALVRVAGHRTDKIVLSPHARPVHVGRVYTGLPRGKAYPYAGAKRRTQPAPEASPETMFEAFDPDCIPGN